MSPHWRGWFALGVLRFGLNPELFWAMSVLEWRALCAALAPDVLPPDRCALEALMRRYPDGAKHDRHL